MISRTSLRRSFHRLALVLVPSVAVLLIAGDVRAHGPDPTVGGSNWHQDQAVGFRWRSGQVPPSWMQGAILAAARDVSATRASRAATFAYASSAPSWIAYGEPTGCGPNGIACFTRGGAPTSFTMSFRRQGYVFDWGSLRWCQVYATFPDGCFDVETIALDEFGHVENLGHHVNLADESDYLDAVVQTISRAKPRTGWSVHRLAPCDTARLQMLYDMQAWTAPYSTCLNLATTMGIAASAETVQEGDSLTLTATLRVASSSSYGTLSGNPVSGRAVVLQRRSIGSSTWLDMGTMTPATTSGTYRMTVTAGSSAEWRARFAATTTEGLGGSTSGTVSVTVVACLSVCPQAVEP